MLDPIRIVLIDTSHPGNIGAAARAMKTMGLGDLRLVRPRLFPHAEATAMAAGADDLLARATVSERLDAALSGCRLVVGASARGRSVPWPQWAPRSAAERLVQAAADGPVAVLFGCERAGLSNLELDRCQALVTIPANPDYSSLNLAASVQVIAYELRQAWLMGRPGEEQAVPPPLATADDLDRFYAHLERVLKAIGFLDAARPDGRVLRRLRRLYARAQPEEDELRILRGILTETERTLRRHGPDSMC